MQTLLMIMGIAVFSLIALIFCMLFMKLYLMMSKFENDEDEEDDLDMTSFNTGLNKGIGIAWMGLYKMWSESGETMLIGTYDNFKIQMNENLKVFFSNAEAFKEWTEKFNKYESSIQKDPPQ